MSELYKAIWMNEFNPGYVVYRDCCEDLSVSEQQCARVHKVALFVDETEADDYCFYRNQLIDKYGSDQLPQITIERLRRGEKV